MADHFWSRQKQTCFAHNKKIYILSFQKCFLSRVCEGGCEDAAQEKVVSWKKFFLVKSVFGSSAPKQFFCGKIVAATGSPWFINFGKQSGPLFFLLQMGLKLRCTIVQDNSRRSGRLQGARQPNKKTYNVRFGETMVFELSV